MAGARGCSAPGGTSIRASILLFLKRKKFDKSSEIRTTVFNQIIAAVLIKCTTFGAALIRERLLKLKEMRVKRAYNVIFGFFNQLLYWKRGGKFCWRPGRHVSTVHQ